MLKEKGDGLEAVWPAVWRKVSGARHNLPEGVHLDDGAPPTYRRKKNKHQAFVENVDFSS